VGTNPQETLTQGNERRNMLDSVGSKVLPALPCSSAVVPKKLVGGGGKSLLMEVTKGHDVAVGQQRRVLLIGQPPLLGGGPHAKETTANEALQALEGDIGAAPWLHLGIGVEDTNSTMAKTQMREA